MKKAFTLIELLVVIAIIAILAAILFPVFAQAKSAAKRTADVSNVKEIALGIMMYMGDSDDRLPLTYQINWDQPRFQGMEWKDSIFPYLKNGGKLPKPSNTPYLPNENTDGGVFASPTYDGNWAPYNNGANPNFNGDQTSRFPRAYALNADAGKNENMGTKDDGMQDENYTIWGRAYTWNNNPIYVRGGSGAVDGLQNIAGTAMVMGTRTPYPAINSWFYAYGCSDANWCGTSNNNVSYARGVGNKMVNLAFFDGHVKGMNAYKSFGDDAYGSRQACNTNSWPCAPAVTGYMTQIGEWK